jgi:hypothetical protein
MTIPASMYKNPSDYLERKEYFSFGCGACQFHRPKPDKLEFHCIAEGKLWPDATQSTCKLFTRKHKRPKCP